MGDLVTDLGPLGVFLLMVPEAACLPIPSEVTLMAAGFSVHSGWMTFPEAVVAAALGNLVGSLAAYAAGRAWGASRLPAPAALRLDGLFERHGDRAAFYARLLPLARTFVSLPAGRARLPLGPFVGHTVAGSALWAAAFVLGGLLAGSAWHAASTWAGRGMLLAVAVFVVGALVNRSRR